jgi:hypothetical protein
LAGKPYIFIFKTFAILTFLLIREDIQQDMSICIDREYIGKESLIKKYLVESIRKSGNSIIPDIYFDEIGKRSQTHKLAINVFRKKEKPTLKVTAKEVLEWVF